MSLVTNGIPDEADLAAPAPPTGCCHVCLVPLPDMKGVGDFCSEACREEARRIEAESLAGWQPAEEVDSLADACQCGANVAKDDMPHHPGCDAIWQPGGEPEQTDFRGNALSSEQLDWLAARKTEGGVK